jgi:molybdate transport system substrate-binding protein
MGSTRFLIAIVLVLTGAARGAWADEVTLVAPGGIEAAIKQLIPGFERASGHTVKATFGSGLGTKQQVARGEPFDVPVVQPPFPEVTASGNVDVKSQRPLATVSVGVAVRTGAAKPDIATPDAVKRMLRQAKSISYPNPAGGAAAGVSFDQTLKALGLADELKPKLKLAPGGAAAMAMVARGEAEIGLTFVSEIITEAGVEVVGPLPREISTPTALVGFVSAHARSAAAATALLNYLSAPAAAAAYKAFGMEPAH